MDAFGRRKEQRLRPGADRSRAGGVDAAIRGLVDRLNRSERYCSTSSCAGRALLLAGTDQTEGQKLNRSWLFVTHQKCQKEDVNKISSAEETSGEQGLFGPRLKEGLESPQTSFWGMELAGLQKAEDNAVFKFEPFVLHVQCREMEDAQLLHSVAINSGFRNSGITVSKKGKIMMAVRSTHCLEVPLCHQGRVLVSDEYIDYLVQVANQKMEENQKRIERFSTGLQSALTAPVPPEQLGENVSTAASGYTHRRRQRTAKKERGKGELAAHSDGESDLSFLMGTT